MATSGASALPGPDRNVALPVPSTRQPGDTHAVYAYQDRSDNSLAHQFSEIPPISSSRDGDSFGSDDEYTIAPFTPSARPFQAPDATSCPLPPARFWTSTHRPSPEEAGAFGGLPPTRREGWRALANAPVPHWAVSPLAPQSFIRSHTHAARGVHALCAIRHESGVAACCRGEPPANCLPVLAGKTPESFRSFRELPGETGLPTFHGNTGARAGAVEPTCAGAWPLQPATSDNFAHTNAARSLQTACSPLGHADRVKHVPECAKPSSQISFSRGGASSLAAATGLPPGALNFLAHSTPQRENSRGSSSSLLHVALPSGLSRWTNVDDQLPPTAAYCECPSAHSPHVTARPRGSLPVFPWLAETVEPPAAYMSSPVATTLRPGAPEDAACTYPLRHAHPRRRPTEPLFPPYDHSPSRPDFASKTGGSFGPGCPRDWATPRAPSCPLPPLSPRSRPHLRQCPPQSPEHPRPSPAQTGPTRDAAVRGSPQLPPGSLPRVMEPPPRFSPTPLSPAVRTFYAGLPSPPAQPHTAHPPSLQFSPVASCCSSASSSPFSPSSASLCPPPSMGPVRGAETGASWSMSDFESDGDPEEAITPCGSLFCEERNLFGEGEPGPRIGLRETSRASGEVPHLTVAARDTQGLVACPEFSPFPAPTLSRTQAADAARERPCRPEPLAAWVPAASARAADEAAGHSAQLKGDACFAFSAPSLRGPEKNRCERGEKHFWRASSSPFPDPASDDEVAALCSAVDATQDSNQGCSGYAVRRRAEAGEARGELGLLNEEIQGSRAAPESPRISASRSIRSYACSTGFDDAAEGASRAALQTPLTHGCEGTLLHSPANEAENAVHRFPLLQVQEDSVSTAVCVAALDGSTEFEKTQHRSVACGGRKREERGAERDNIFDAGPQGLDCLPQDERRGACPREEREIAGADLAPEEEGRFSREQRQSDLRPAGGDLAARVFAFSDERDAQREDLEPQNRRDSVGDAPGGRSSLLSEDTGPIWRDVTNELTAESASSAASACSWTRCDAFFGFPWQPPKVRRGQVETERPCVPRLCFPVAPEGDVASLTVTVGGEEGSDRLGVPEGEESALKLRELRGEGLCVEGRADAAWLVQHTAASPGCVSSASASASEEELGSSLGLSGEPAGVEACFRRASHRLSRSLSVSSSALFVLASPREDAEATYAHLSAYAPADCLELAQHPLKWGTPAEAEPARWRRKVSQASPVRTRKRGDACSSEDGEVATRVPRPPGSRQERGAATLSFLASATDAQELNMEVEDENLEDESWPRHMEAGIAMEKCLPQGARPASLSALKKRNLDGSRGKATEEKEGSAAQETEKRNELALRECDAEDAGVRPARQRHKEKRQFARQDLLASALPGFASAAARRPENKETARSVRSRKKKAKETTRNGKTSTGETPEEADSGTVPSASREGGVVSADSPRPGLQVCGDTCETGSSRSQKNSGLPRSPSASSSLLSSPNEALSEARAEDSALEPWAETRLAGASLSASASSASPSAAAPATAAASVTGAAAPVAASQGSDALYVAWWPTAKEHFDSLWTDSKAGFAWLSAASGTEAGRRLLSESRGGRKVAAATREGVQTAVLRKQLAALRLEGIQYVLRSGSSLACRVGFFTSHHRDAFLRRYGADSTSPAGPHSQWLQDICLASLLAFSSIPASTADARGGRPLEKSSDPRRRRKPGGKAGARADGRAAVKSSSSLSCALSLGAHARPVAVPLSPSDALPLASCLARKAANFLKRLGLEDLVMASPALASEAEALVTPAGDPVEDAHGGGLSLAPPCLAVFLSWLPLSVWAKGPRQVCAFFNERLQRIVHFKCRRMHFLPSGGAQLEFDSPAYATQFMKRYGGCRESLGVQRFLDQFFPTLDVFLSPAERLTAPLFIFQLPRYHTLGSLPSLSWLPSEPLAHATRVEEQRGVWSSSRPSSRTGAEAASREGESDADAEEEGSGRNTFSESLQSSTEAGDLTAGTESRTARVARLERGEGQDRKKKRQAARRRPRHREAEGAARADPQKEVRKIGKSAEPTTGHVPPRPAEKKKRRKATAVQRARGVVLK
ncbi:hypothetical protein BESB_073920 [Besnoitia besnoiti]|uniref:Uncharacterized protein n=1 Tax=Besnoitia besnoiti TaxID=94643 RepID=A0A2A9MFT3_BESBE|nr:uncharacterized protein BESB_073920 [Besnoitia besnoiti]PFH34240.1 hypothetical protein BESB_073920 [Besnoitia besnoiti]